MMDDAKQEQVDSNCCGFDLGNSWVSGVHHMFQSFSQISLGCIRFPNLLPHTHDKSCRVLVFPSLDVHPR